MFDVERLGREDNLLVVIYRDTPFLPRWFGNKFIHPVLVRPPYPTNINWRDPRSLLAVLMEQTRFDHIRGLETDLAHFSMDVWVQEEYRQPGCAPLLRGWRYTPALYATKDGTVAA